MKPWKAKGLSVFEGSARIARAFPEPTREAGHVTACLIAAAPELYSELDFLFNNVRLNVSPVINDRIRNVLSKAKGTHEVDSD